MDLDEFFYSFSLSPLTVRLTVVVFFLLFAYTPAEGQLQVIGSLQPIMAAPGDNVILPCHVKPAINVAGLTVEWSRPDRQPDPKDRLSRFEYVHLYRDNCEVPDMKISSYVRRTELFTDGLRQGNISLKIINVTLADEGKYKCFIPKLKSRKRASLVHLVIDGRSSRSRLTLVGVVCILLILSVGVGGYRFTYKCPKRSD